MRKHHPPFFQRLARVSAPLLLGFGLSPNLGLTMERIDPGTVQIQGGPILIFLRYISAEVLEKKAVRDGRQWLRFRRSARARGCRTG